MTPRLTLVDIAPHHAGALARLHQEVFGEAAWDEASLCATITQPSAWGHLAGPEHTPAGFILLQGAAGEAEIVTLAVAPCHRRQGLGRQLLETALAGARARGAQALFLEVDDGNEAAKALYVGAGFAPIGRRPGYYAHPEGRADAVVLRRDLAPM
jgi:ribosomal-protein-alanine N-acetyltransferase